MKNSLSIIVLGVLLQFKASLLFGQRLELGGGMGVTNYKGDLYPRFKPFAVNAGANAFVRYNFVPSGISIKGTGTIGRLSAKESRVDDPLQQLRKLEFQTNFWEVGGQVEYNFFHFRSTAMYNSDWTPYLFAGYNYYSLYKRRLNIAADANSPYYLQEYTADSVGHHNGMAIPFGIGIKKAIGKRLNLTVEFGTRKTFSDTAIDNLGFDKNNQPNLLDVANGGSFPQRQMATPNTYFKDMYYYTNISLSYVFYRVYCPNGSAMPTLRKRNGKRKK